MIHSVKATEFADPGDLRAFQHAKAEGMSDRQAFRVGDNCIGCWGDSTAQDTGPCCAIPPDDMIAEFGSIAEAKHKQVLVTNPALSTSCVCTIKDRMPWKAHISNGAGIDLNPDAIEALFLPKGGGPVTWGPIERATPV